MTDLLTNLLYLGCIAITVLLCNLSCGGVCVVLIALGLYFMFTGYLWLFSVVEFVDFCLLLIGCVSWFVVVI